MLRWSACPCRTPLLSRVERRVWMRFLPFSKLYNCEKCGSEILSFSHRGPSVPATSERPTLRRFVQGVVIALLVVTITTVGLSIAEKRGGFSLLLNVP